MAPFEVVICPMNFDRSELVRAAADNLYAELLAAGVDVVLDDRGERPGAMFADWELIGVPFRIVVGERGLKDAQVEFQGRLDTEAQLVPLAKIKEHIITTLSAAKNKIAQGIA
jgi:prolyl-tRNA synthetase